MFYTIELKDFILAVILFIIYVSCILIGGAIIYLLKVNFLNKFNKLIYGKFTVMSLIPIFDIYLLGKLTINKAVGWILVICLFLIARYTVVINGNVKTYAIFPENVNKFVLLIYCFIILGLLIYAIIKYNKLKKQVESIQKTK